MRLERNDTIRDHHCRVTESKKHYTAKESAARSTLNQGTTVSTKKGLLPSQFLARVGLPIRHLCILLSIRKIGQI